MTQHNIYIVGAGAIGKALSVFLQAAGRNVVLIRGSVDDQPDRVEKLEVELPDGVVLTEDIVIKTIRQCSRFDGPVVVATKSFGNVTLAAALRSKIGAVPVVILQNGLHVEQPFLDAGIVQLYRCVLFATSQLVSANRARFKPVAVSSIGVIKGNEEGLAGVVHQLNNPYFPFQAEPQIQPVIWTKAIVNCVFNSICPLLETDNGVFYKNEKALCLAKRVIAECVAVANEAGVLLDAETVTGTLLRISESSEGQLISTYQDIQNRRPTEIETLNFAIVSAARALKRGDAVKETELLGDLLLLKSALHR